MKRKHLGPKPDPKDSPARILRRALKLQRRIVMEQARLRPGGAAWYDHDLGRPHG